MGLAAAPAHIPEEPRLGRRRQPLFSLKWPCTDASLPSPTHTQSSDMFLIDSWLWLKAKKIKSKHSADTQIPGLHMLNKHYQQHFVTRGGSAENTMMVRPRLHHI